MVLTGLSCVFSDLDKHTDRSPAGARKTPARSSSTFLCLCVVSPHDLSSYLCRAAGLLICWLRSAKMCVLKEKEPDRGCLSWLSLRSLTVSFYSLEENHYPAQIERKGRGLNSTFFGFIIITVVSGVF